MGDFLLLILHSKFVLLKTNVSQKCLNIDVLSQHSLVHCKVLRPTDISNRCFLGKESLEDHFTEVGGDWIKHH